MRQALTEQRLAMANKLTSASLKDSREPVSRQTIYAYTAELLDAEGPKALNARRLAADLGISTRTLYELVGKRDQLIREVVARHFAALKLEFSPQESWEKSVTYWAQTLRRDLRAHPNLTQLMEPEDRAAVVSYVQELINTTVNEGFSPEQATKFARAIVNLTIHHAAGEVNTASIASGEILKAELENLGETFHISLGLMIDGARSQAQQR